VINQIKGQGQGQGEFGGEEGEEGDNKKNKEISAVDVREAILRRNLWDQTAKSLIKINEECRKLREGNDEENREMAISMLDKKPDDDVKKQLKNLHVQIGDLLKQDTSFLPPKPVEIVSKSGVNTSVVGDVAPETTGIDNGETFGNEFDISIKAPNGVNNQISAQRQQIIMQQKQIQKLQNELSKNRK